ncbi:MAG: hypothetical protein WC551_10150 [Patescibacteria group bacterium]
MARTPKATKKPVITAGDTDVDRVVREAPQINAYLSKAFDAIIHGDRGKWEGKNVSETKALGVNPRAMFQRTDFGTSGFWLERPGVVEPQQIRNYVSNVEQLSTIHTVFGRQTTRFARPAMKWGDVGWRVHLRDQNEEETEQDRRNEKWLTSWIWSCGNEFNPTRRRALGRKTFSEHLLQISDDTLHFGQILIEKERLAHAPGLAAIHAVDAATIRHINRDRDAVKTPVVLQSLDGKSEEVPEDARYVQVIDRLARHAFSNDQMIFHVRSPGTSIWRRGYGIGEAESCMKTSLGLFLFMDINLEMLDDNMIPPGLLYIKGAMSQGYSDELRKEIMAGRGNGKRFTLPVWVVDDVMGGSGDARFIPFYTWDDIQNEKLAMVLHSLVCAAYGITMEEAGLRSYGSNTSPLSGSDTAERLANSWGNGFIPRMETFEAITDEILCEINPAWGDRYTFEFVGLRNRDEQWTKQNIVSVATVNEMRKLCDMPPLDDPLLGDAPLNPSLIPMYQQQHGMGGFGGGGEDFGGGEYAEPEKETPQDQPQDDAAW